MQVAVTTPLRPAPEEDAAARACALRFGLLFAPRGNRGLEHVAAGCGAEAFLVLSARRATLAVPASPTTSRQATARGGAWTEHVWSAGMGLLRMKRALRRVDPAGGACRFPEPPGLSGPGSPDRPFAPAFEPTEHDPFLEAAGVRPGDAVLDCTLGLGADALVAAAAAGPEGRVVGLEASPALAAWAAEGLARLAAAPARRVEVRAGDHAAALAALPDRSFDVVVFDPMFRHARAEPGGFDAVRLLADPRPLAPAALARARRVARRCVVVKDGAPGWDLARLGLTPLPSARGAHRYYARLAAE
ncbi:MAG TPA: class I SAM-dependent methyltransferase [Anaeromyxobacteraceae bacterium]|nr:class I SAM-dependent methyltransferase [Anaeromyxobacteraceae bacterium]